MLSSNAMVSRRIAPSLASCINVMWCIAHICRLLHGAVFNLSSCYTHAYGFVLPFHCDRERERRRRREEKREIEEKERGGAGGEKEIESERESERERVRERVRQRQRPRVHTALGTSYTSNITSI